MPHNHLPAADYPLWGDTGLDDKSGEISVDAASILPDNEQTESTTVETFTPRGPMLSGVQAPGERNETSSSDLVTAGETGPAVTGREPGHDPWGHVIADLKNGSPIQLAETSRYIEPAPQDELTTGSESGEGTRSTATGATLAVLAPPTGPPIIVTRHTNTPSNAPSETPMVLPPHQERDVFGQRLTPSTSYIRPPGATVAPKRKRKRPFTKKRPK